MVFSLYFIKWQQYSSGLSNWFTVQFRRLNGLIRLSSLLLVERAKAKPTTLGDMAEEQQRSSSLRTIYVEFQIILSHRTVKPRTSPTCSRISLITVGHRCHTDARLTTSSRRHLCPLRLIAGLYSIRAQKKKPNAIFRSQRSDNKFINLCMGS